MAEPMYRRIAGDLRRRMESGEFPPGQQLPTELELREQYDNASRNTVRDAVRALTVLGLVETRPGRGTYVVERLVPFVITMSSDPETGLGGGEGGAYMAEARAQMRKAAFTDPRVELQQATGRVAEELQLAEGDQVVSRHQRLTIDKKPWSLQTSFYPMTLVDKGARRLLEAKDIKNGTVRYVMESAGMEQVGYQDKIIARPADRTEADFFELTDERGVSVMESVRTAYERSGTPIRCTVTVWSADRNLLVYNIGDVPSNVTVPVSRDSVAGPSERGDGG